MSISIVTIWPGPVLMVWRDGERVASVDLSQSAAIVLASQLLSAVSRLPPALTNTPNENLPFAEHRARREAERGQP